MRRILFFVFLTLCSAGTLRADDIQFYSHGWADSSGKNGKGGVSVVCDGDKHNFLFRPDAAKDKIDAKAAADHPDWVIQDSDLTNGNCFSFEFTWVTTPNDKFWGNKWAGGGIAFDNSWNTHDLSAAKFLVLSVRTNAPGVDFNIGLTGSTDSAQTGNVKLSDFVPGKKLTETWTKAIIPFAAIPGMSGLDLTKVKTLRFDLQGDYPENKLVFVHFDKVYFTDSAMVTPVENLGWIREPGGVELIWDKSNDDGVLSYLVTVDGKVVGRVTGAKKRRVKLVNALFPGTGPHKVGVAADNGKQASTYEEVEIGAATEATASAAVSVSPVPSRSISPYIWGFNYVDTESLRKMGGTLNRWGGNATTGYNWKDDAENHGSDWFFLNSGGPVGIAEKDKSYYKFFTDTKAAGADSIITIPITGWVAKVPPPSTDGKKFGSYPLSLFPTEAPGGEPGLGNGQTADGKLLWGNDPNYNYLPSDPAFQAQWVKSLIQDFGSSTQGGVKIYQMDNEPGLWRWTHRDIRPKGVGYEELADLNATYAQMVKQTDPNAKVIGMTAWGVMELAGSNWDYMPGGESGYQLPDSAMTDALKWTDRKAHGNVPQVVYFLREMAKRSQKAGVRLIDYIDFHGFPEVWGKDQNGKSIKLMTDDIPYDPVVCEKQFDALRIFWDPTFENPDSWCFSGGNKPYLWDPFVGMLPKMKKIVAENYPGTKISMTEYYPSSKSYYHGGLLEAATLGIFMREGLDLACDWDGSHAGNYVFLAHELYSNYDGNGSKVGGNYLPSASSSPDLYSFAAKDAAKTYVVFVNKNPSTDIATTLYLPAAVSGYHTYTLSKTSGKRLYDSGLVPAAGSTVKLNIPAFSALLVVAQ
ncbi:MAG TPA: glycoside hydrolase family 44 protein [bacterium]|nr:glycoside hydrolase family 44 protein [bacterium]